MKTITLNLVVSLIMEAVKAETLIKGRVDKATDDKASALAFEEEAGDHEYHNRKLYRTMHTSFSRLVSKIGDYVENVFASSADNIFYQKEPNDNDVITLHLSVSDRFNESFCDPLAKLCSKFIEDHMLYLWWGTFNVKQAEFYNKLVEADIEDIRACFTKTSPAVPTTSYTSYINTQLGDTYRVKRGDVFSLTYLVSDSCIDDVEIEITDFNALQILGKKGQTFSLKALRTGIVTAVLYSRHDNTVNHSVKIIVA